MQRSASALYEAGNTIDESIALITGANSVIQNPEQVGTALKTLALRLRGAKVELEEAGEDVDGMAESTSQLQEKLLALTHGKVDIMLDENTFKNTTQILREMSAAWEHMTDIERASALELMGGKRQANILSSVIKNFDTVEDVITTSMDSAGSALRENEKYLESIQGRIDIFNNAVQTMWMNLIDSSMVKSIVDIGTFLVKQLDTLHGKLIAIVGVLAVYKKFKDETTFADMFTGAVNTIKEVYSSMQTMITATNLATKSDIARALAAKGVNKELVAQIIAESGLKGVKTSLIAIQVKATAATLTEKYATHELTTAQYLAAMSTMGLKTALQGLWNVLKANPVYAIAAVITVAAVAFDHFHTTAQEAADTAKKAFDEIQNVVDSTKSTIQELETELSTLQDKINELDGKSLSFAEDQELEKLKAQREELERSLKVQKQLLELQQDASNKQAIASMKAYTKAASEGADETQETAKTWGTISGVVAGIAAAAGVIAAIPTGGLSLGATAASVGAMGIAGGVAGNKLGEAVGSGVASNKGTYDSWYETYTKALDAARKDEQEALEKYQKDSSNIDKLDKWQETQQRTSEIEKEMYDHLSQMQQYMNSLEYGVSDEIDAELDTWNNFLDKFSIGQGASGSEVTALDRIFGENASDEIQAIKEQILEAVKTGKDFDFTSAINGSQELKDTLDYVGLSAEDVKNYFTQIGEVVSNVSVKEITPVATYSDLLEDAEAYKEVLLQTSEIIVDNTKVTDDYKDSLIALVGSEAEVNKYFDKTNKLVVKDAKGLNALVQATKKNVAANTSLAKSQARLQYYQLFKKMQACVGAKGVMFNATKSEVLALYQEMNALEKTIAQYSRLEAQLLDIGNAYDQFEKAQEIDNATDYVGSIETWIAALGEAFNTAELGTESAQVAIKGLVPESVYKDLDTVDEKMAAIYSYFKTGKLAQYVDIQFDEDGAIESAEMKLGNLRKFIEDGLTNGTLIGSDWRHFDLSEDIDSLEEFADAMGVTKEVAFAFIESMEDHDIEWLNGDYSSIFEDILPDNLANDIYENTSALADLAAQLANGEITAEEYTAQWSELNKVSQENAQKARENATAWIETSNDIEAAKTKVQELSGELQTLKQQGASEAEIQVKTQELNAAKQDLTNLVAKLSELETMDPVVLQVALDQAQAEIDEFETANSTLLTKIEVVQDKESGEYSYNVKAGITLDENEKKKLEGYLEDINAKYSFEAALGEDIVTAEDHLQSIENILQSIHDVLSGKNSSGTKSTDATEVTESVDANGFKEFFTTTIPDALKGLWEDIDIFFTETIPEKWSQFWEEVGNKFSEIIEKAGILKEKVTDFFTNTVPEKWDGFWDEVGEKVADIKKFAGELQEKVDNFFTKTFPQKWDGFWDEVETFLVETLPYTLSYSAGTVSRFFTETIPQKWDEFWDAVKAKLNEVRENAKILREKIVNYFTVLIPQKWNEFWDDVGVKLEELKAEAKILKEKVVTFFTVTIPEKWNAFWDSVGAKIEELKKEAQILKVKITDFFTVTIPQKWNAFWDDVGTFITTTIPSALETIKTGVTTFFTVTVPNAINGLWNGISSWISEKASNLWSSLTSGWSDGRSGSGYNPSGSSGRQRVNGTAHARGTAYQSGNWGLPKSEHDSLVGELGPEMVVDPSSGRYYTVGDNGAEMVDLPKGAIIFNHKQTESLLNNGYVTSRGKAYAEGNAHVTIWPNASSKPQWEGTGYDSWYDPTWDASDAFSNAADDMSDAADSMSDAADTAEQVVDFIEMKLEEIEAIIEKTTTRISNFLDDTTDVKSKDELYDELVKAEKYKSETYLKAAQKYEVQAAAALSGVPQQYQAMARNGAIDIKDFIGEDQVEIVEKIQEYRDWATKADEAENGHLEAIAAISAHRVEQLEDIATDFENIVSISKSHSDLLQAEMDFIEESGNRLSEDYYEELKKHSQKQLDDMQAERAALQKILDDAVAAGDVVIGSDDWYSMLETIYEVDKEIVDCKTSLEEFQNAINELYWDNFDKLIEQLDTVDSELSNLYDLVSDAEDVVDEAGNWTADGYTALGLLVQQMEVAQQKSEEYSNAISKLKKDYKDGLYSTDEYNEKLAELTDGQYDAIKSYEDAKDAIVDLNKTRVDAVKDGINKEIDAYEELISKKKESLDADKDARDFERSVEESSKSISDVERKIASLKGNTSSSAMAERKRLEAELRKLQQEREDLFYNESVENQQEALDKELENFQGAKNKEIEDLEEYLKNQEKVLQDSFAIVQENTQQIAGKLVEIAENYGVTISDTVATPWINGTNAIGKYQEQLNTSVSATTKNLETLKQQLKDLETQADKTANSVINATHSTVVKTNDGHQTSIKGYAKGSKSVEYDQWALIDELGDELQLVPNEAGRLDYIKKGTGILNNTLTEKLIDLAVDPTSMLENSRPVIGAPGITTTNNTITIDASVGTLLHVDHLDGSNPAEVAKLVDKAWEKKMQTLNNSIKKFTR